MSWLKEYNQTLEESRRTAELAKKASTLHWEQVKREKDTYWDPLWNKLESEQISQLYRLWEALQLSNLLEEMKPALKHKGDSLSVGGPTLYVPISYVPFRQETEKTSIFTLSLIKTKPQKKGWLRQTENKATDLWKVYGMDGASNDRPSQTYRTVKEAILAFTYSDLNTCLTKLGPPELLGELVETTETWNKDEREGGSYCITCSLEKFTIFLSGKQIRTRFGQNDLDNYGNQVWSRFQEGPNVSHTGNTEADSTHLREEIDHQIAELFKSGSL